MKISSVVGPAALLAASSLACSKTAISPESTGAQTAGASGNSGTAGAGGQSAGAGGQGGPAGAAGTSGAGGGGAGEGGAGGAAGASSKLAFAPPDIAETGVRQAHCIVPVAWSKDGRVDVLTAHDWTPTYTSSSEFTAYYDLWRIVDGKLTLVTGPISLEPAPGAQTQVGLCVTTDLDHDGTVELTTSEGHWVRPGAPIGKTAFWRVSDLDGDGAWEALAIAADGKTVSGAAIESKDGSTWIAQAEVYSIKSPFVVGGVYGGDFDGDGRGDLVLHETQGTKQVQLLRSAPGGPEQLAVTSALDDFFSAQVADMNGDGRADLVGRGKKGYQVAFSDGKGGFATQVLFPNSAVEGIAPADSFAVGDVSGDGRPDLVVDSPAGVYVLESDGPGTWRPVRLVVDWKHWDQNTLGQLHMIRIVDMDGDGKNDLVARRDFSLVAFRNIIPSP